jgi:hypothetical protein
LEDGDQEILCHGFSRISTDQKTTKDVSVKSVKIRGPVSQALTAIPYTLLEASSMASSSVGWA